MDECSGGIQIFGSQAKEERILAGELPGLIIPGFPEFHMGRLFRRNLGQYFDRLGIGHRHRGQFRAHFVSSITMPLFIALPDIKKPAGPIRQAMKLAIRERLVAEIDRDQAIAQPSKAIELVFGWDAVIFILAEFSPIDHAEFGNAAVNRSGRNPPPPPTQPLSVQPPQLASRGLAALFGLQGTRSDLSLDGRCTHSA